MKKIYGCLFYASIVSTFLASSVCAQFNYISPRPGSKYHSPRTTIILKAGGLLDGSSINNIDLVTISGSQSGYHSWKPILSEERTLIIKPDQPFSPGETVTIIIGSFLRKKDGSSVTGTSFSFEVSKGMTDEQMQACISSNSDYDEMDHSYESSAIREECETDSMPTFQITVNNNPAPGQIFYNNQLDEKDDTNSFPAIIENDGTIVWTCDLGLNGHDFKINYTGYLTYFNYNAHAWFVLDSNLNTIDTVKCGNGHEIETNGHDIVMYPDGHSFVLAYNPEIVDMSLIVPGGKTTATVKGFIVQELDAEKNVIFEWRSWDNFLITDANPTVGLTGFLVDPVHGNAVERDIDGNIMISSRNMSEITKINLETGEMMWRLGGENNQFTFVNDVIPEHFAFQHDIRRIDNGHVTLFNNGVDLPQQISNAKEYELDEVNKVATLKWFYQHPPIGINQVLGTGSGSVQRLPNGNTLISWGKTVNYFDGSPDFTEVDSAGNILWEFLFDEVHQRGYRVHKYTWQPCDVVSPELLKTIKITSNTANIVWSPVKNAISYDVQYRKSGNVNWKTVSTVKTSQKLKNLLPVKEYEYRVRVQCLNGYASDWSPIESFNTAPLRMEEEKEPITLYAYPNPASEIITFEFDMTYEDAVLITISDLAGNKVASYNFGPGEGKIQLPVDIAALPDGFYLARVRIGSQTIIQKFVKH